MLLPLLSRPSAVFVAVLLLGNGGRIIGLSAVQTTQARPSAAELYVRAAKLIVAYSPAETNLEYKEYPPYVKKWQDAARDAWEKNAPMRLLARQARETGVAGWPDVPKEPALKVEFGYLNNARGIANELGDAALYAHELGDDREAIALVRDTRYLSQTLRTEKKEGTLIHGLVSVGIDAIAMSRLLVLAPAIKLSKTEDSKAVSVADVRKLIAELSEPFDAEAYIIAVEGKDYRAKFDAAERQAIPDPASRSSTSSTDRAFETFRRVGAERTFGAMSLAAQLFRFENHRWPATLDELVGPAYLPAKSVDPWGDGTQTYGYVLIKGGLPDGSDRPLVYSRSGSRDGLFFRVDEPQYSFYQGDGSHLPMAQQKRGGQFRDLATWVPQAQVGGAPTIRRLNP